MDKPAPKISRTTKAEYDRRYFERYPEKHAAYLAIKRLKKMPGFHLHHWSYNHDHLKDVIAMPIDQHTNFHRFIVYDQERRMYRRFDTNVLLNTKKKHEEFISYIEMQRCVYPVYKVQFEPNPLLPETILKSSTI